jgi:hydrogenase 3 maturation protease
MRSQHSTNDENIEISLRRWLSNARKVVVAGIGNPLRKDDFVGIEVVRNLRDNVSQSVYLVECETVPESFIESIAEFNPTHILIPDAAILNLKPGSSKLIDPDQMANLQSISTHALPLQIFCRYLQETTGAQINILAIQPEDTSFGEGLTEKVENAAKHLGHLLSEILP